MTCSDWLGLETVKNFITTSVDTIKKVVTSEAPVEQPPDMGTYRSPGLSTLNTPSPSTSYNLNQIGAGSSHLATSLDSAFPVGKSYSFFPFSPHQKPNTSLEVSEEAGAMLPLSWLMVVLLRDLKEKS